MKKETRQRLKDLESKQLQIKFPNVPLHCLAHTTFKESSANELTKTIINFIRLHGYQAERINTMGRFVGPKKYTDFDGRERTIGKGKYIPSTGTKGSADISATIAGRSIKIEVKYGKDRQSEAQKQYQQSIEQAGGIYIIARDVDGFVEWYDEFIAEVK
jgi:hypothetical protein